MEIQGRIFDIKRFAVHDGPGIRTTIFFKGCPLSCLWCHNPEGISPCVEVMVFTERCLAGCRDCVGVCPKTALTKKGRRIVIDRSRCDGCGLCAEACPAGALQMAGRRVTAGEAVEQLSRDTAFYRNSGGGITCSGGEPLLQPRFLQALLRACRKHMLHTTVDTCGHAPFGDFEKILPLTDLFLYDLKIMDEGRHRRLTGVSNRLIIENLQKLSLLAPNLTIRVPLVPGCNDAPADLAELADFCASLPGSHPVHLLPYHRSGGGKNRRLGREAPLTETRSPSPAAVQRVGEIFSNRKLTVKIGG